MGFRELLVEFYSRGKCAWNSFCSWTKEGHWGKIRRLADGRRQDFLVQILNIILPSHAAFCFFVLGIVWVLSLKNWVLLAGVMSGETSAWPTMIKSLLMTGRYWAVLESRTVMRYASNASIWRLWIWVWILLLNRVFWFGLFGFIVSEPHNSTCSNYMDWWMNSMPLSFSYCYLCVKP